MVPICIMLYNLQKHADILSHLIFILVLKADVTVLI